MTMKLRSLALILAFVLVGLAQAVARLSEQSAAASSSTDQASAGFDYNYFERYLQTSETTTCNFWCQLKNSLGLTIVGLLLICIR
jgi:hypothetical protein